MDHAGGRACRRGLLHRGLASGPAALQLAPGAKLYLLDEQGRRFPLVADPSVTPNQRARRRTHNDVRVFPSAEHRHIVGYPLVQDMQLVIGMLLGKRAEVAKEFRYPDYLRYCASLTFSIQSTNFPSSAS